MTTFQEVLVPDIGDFTDVPIIEVMVKPGETVKPDQSLITIESDKATVDVPSPFGGVVGELKVKLGDRVSKGTVILTLAADAGEPPAAAPPAAARPTGTGAPTPAVRSGPAPAAAAPPSGRDHATVALPYASPAVRQLARTLSVDLDRVRGSGNKGRILKEDVEAFAGGQAAGKAAPVAAGAAFELLPWPKVDFAKFGPVQATRLARIRKISGANLARNWVMIPHVTNHEDADITDLDAVRSQMNKEHEPSGVKITMLAFLIKAAVASLKQFPEFNSSLDGEHLILKGYYHIGFAADTPNGLMVPVIRDADRKSVLDIAAELRDLAKLAREGTLKPDQMDGGCFTISSLGGIGGTYFTPIVNAPEVAIMGACKAIHRPAWDGSTFVPRLVLPLSLSWDHRVIDGAAAARFNAYFAQVLADTQRMLL